MSNQEPDSIPGLVGRDWEDSNKLGFVLIVQTLLLIRTHYHTKKPGKILFQAMRIRKADIPMDLEAAAEEFLDWADGISTQPAWIKSPLPISGIAGL